MTLKILGASKEQYNKAGPSIGRLGWGAGGEGGRGERGQGWKV